MKHKFIYLFFCIGLLAGCGGNTQQGAGSKEYAVEAVKNISSEMTATYPATIKGKQDIEIRPKVAGFITELCVDEGSFVRKGQTLFKIDRVQYEANVNAAKASVRVAEASVSTQKLTVDNKRELNKKEIISDYDLEMAENQLASYEANLAQAKANLASAEDNLSFTLVSSPSDGIVGTIPYRIGSLVSSSVAEPLTVVSDISKMYAYFAMTEKQLLEITKGGDIDKALAEMPDVKLQLADGSIYPYSGRIETISGVIDQTTGSVTLRAAFPNEGKVLRSGGTGNVLVPYLLENVMAVPQSATVEIQDKKFVYVVQDDNTVKNVEVTVFHINDGKNYLVTSGLNPGDRIVVEGVQALTDGQKITPITRAQQQANYEQALKDQNEGNLETAFK